MVDALQPQDVISGAQVRDGGNLFVLGCYDSRVTFYSQQVRALSLVHALKHLGYLNGNPRIAVIGAGAAGLAAAAAAALVSTGQVVLFESARELLPLQSGTDRRNLDPHIYDWPAIDTTDPVADLPILDWEAGSCRTVRGDIIVQFEDIRVRMGGRLEQQLRHRVTKLRREGNSYEVVFHNLDVAPPEPGSEPSEAFDMVLLAIGFGLEPTEVVRGIQTASYWSDAGVPVGEFEARPHPRFLISGKGDGGLIDFVAAGDRSFNHAAMIQLISIHPGIDDLAGAISAIDARARQAHVNGRRFDFLAAYDNDLFARLTEIGLVAAVGRRLRPGVQLTLQTRHAEIFDLSASALNRLAAYLTIKACEADPQCAFRHVQCADIERVYPADADPHPPPFLIDCAGEILPADSVIIRRGPQHAVVRRPFDEQLETFEATHKEWLARHGDATLVPKLSHQARALFAAAARDAHIPQSPRLQREAPPQLPIAVQLRASAPDVRWSGAVPPQALVRAWSEHQAFEVILPDRPAALGAATGAILRVACHGHIVRLRATPALWRGLVDRLSIGSLQAQGMTMPVITAGNPGGAAQDPHIVDPARLARDLHHALDAWLLERLDQHLVRFFANGEDPGRLISLPIAPDLCAAMAARWDEWRQAFRDEPALLNHFLRLMVCAVDTDDDRDVAQVLVGPTKFAAIARGTAVSLAIAAAWQTAGPKAIRPGNLFRQRGEAPDWAGHSCAADLINGNLMSLCAANYMWQTQFVILAVPCAVEVARGAERPFAQIDTQQPSLSETDGSGPVMMWISGELRDSMAAGLVALVTLLATIETRHFDELERAILRGSDA